MERKIQTLSDFFEEHKRIIKGYREELLEIKKRSPQCLHDPARIGRVIAAYHAVVNCSADTLLDTIAIVQVAFPPDARKRAIIAALQSQDFSLAMDAIQKHPLVRVSGLQ